MYRSLLNNAYVHADNCNDRTARYICPHCDAPVHLRKGTERAAHFAHSVVSACPFSDPANRESEDHFEATKLISESLRVQGYDVKLGRHFQQMRLGLMASKPDAESPDVINFYAVEVQKPNMSYAQWRVKADWFEAKGIIPIWVRVTGYEYPVNEYHNEELFGYERNLLMVTGYLFHFNPTSNPSMINVIEKGYPDAFHKVPSRDPGNIVREPMDLKLFDPAKLVDLAKPNEKGANRPRKYPHLMVPEFRPGNAKGVLRSLSKALPPAAPQLGSSIPAPVRLPLPIASKGVATNPTPQAIPPMAPFEPAVRSAPPVPPVFHATGPLPAVLPAAPEQEKAPNSRLLAAKEKLTKTMSQLATGETTDWFEDGEDLVQSRYKAHCVKCGDFSAFRPQTLCDRCDVFWEMIPAQPLASVN
jgi:Competence protein CoiA-like family